MRKLFTALLGLGLPIAMVVGFWLVVNPRPPEPAPSTPLEDATLLSSGDGTAMVGSPDGAWTLVEGGDSFAGYRVEEHYDRHYTPSEGWGRTEAVSASMTIEGLTVTSLEAEADLQELASESPRRDAAIRGRYLETDTFRWVRFGLTEPVVLDPLPNPGQVTEFTVTGELEVRDHVEPLEFEVQTRWDGDEIRVVGLVPIALTDFGIEPPSIPGFVTVADEATFELDLTFTRG